MRRIYQCFLYYCYIGCTDFLPVYRRNFHSTGNGYLYNRQNRIFPVLLQLHICRIEYFFLLLVYCIFRWENFRDHFLRAYLCPDRNQYPGAASYSRSKRNLAFCTNRRMYDRLFIRILYLEETALLSLLQIDIRKIPPHLLHFQVDVAVFFLLR